MTAPPKRDVTESVASHVFSDVLDVGHVNRVCRGRWPLRAGPRPAGASAGDPRLEGAVLRPDCCQSLAPLCGSGRAQ